MKKPLNLTMDVELKKEIKKRAIEEGTNVSQIIEKLVKKYLETNTFGGYK